ncbi:MAG: CxxH/CxxC protein [Thermoanaerobacteraceae bacterium]|nr:CxxH/CxxC protein [Thermoanaerobacteraceae bacterium]
MYVVCAEHLDRAIDEFVEVYESPPDLYILDEVSFTDWITPSTCDFCDRAPHYLVV